jgi:tetratricopeptide (TPR) repeat protein
VAALALGGLAVPVQQAPKPLPSPSPSTSSTAPRRAAPAALSFSTLSSKADAARTAGRLEEAAGYYEKALALRPDWHDGRLNLAAILGDLKRYKEAREHLNRLTAAGQGGGEAYALLGLACSRLRDYDASLTAFERARAAGIAVPELRAASIYEAALVLNRAGNPDAAFDALRVFSTEGNDSPNVIVAFGLALLRMPKMPDEVPDDKRDLVTLAGRGGYHMARPRRTAVGRLALEEMVSRYPSEPNVHYALGLYLAPDDPSAAAEEFRRELRLTADHGPALIQLAHLETRRGDATAALPLAEKAVSLSPAVPAGWLVLGRALLDLERAEDAIPPLEKAAELAPANADVQFALSRAYQRAGKPEAAARARDEFQRLKDLGSGKGAGETGPPLPADQASIDRGGSH